MSSDWKAVEPTEADVAEAARLIAEGYRQTSYRYRMVARVPNDTTALEEIRKRNPSDARRLEEQFKQWCDDCYLRCYAESIELTREIFAAFKQQNGKVA